MSIEPRYVKFLVGQLDEVVATMKAMSRAGAGWINLQPEVEADLLPPDSGFFGVFSGRGPAVPLATWTPPSTTSRGRSEPTMIGLQHPAGSRAKKRLADAGHPVPDGWVVTQDHTKKGLVVSVPPSATHAEIIEWLMRAASILSTIPLHDRWRAAVYER